MPTDKPRFTITMDQDLFNRINEFQHENRMNSQTKAVIELINRGITLATQIPENGSVSKGVGERIKLSRKAKKMSQEELGNLLGIGKSSISEWESGKRSVPIDTIEEIANILDVNVPYLMGWDINMETHKYETAELSPAALSLARRYDALDEHSKKVVDAVVDLESKRPSDYASETARFNGLSSLPSTDSSAQ